MESLERKCGLALVLLIFVVTQIGASSAFAATTPEQDAERAGRVAKDRADRAAREERVQQDRAVALRYVHEHSRSIVGDANSQFRERVAIPAGEVSVVRFTQVYRGIPVYAAELILTVRDEVVWAMTSAVEKNLDLGTVWNVTKDDAMKFARARHQQTGICRKCDADLVIVPARSFGETPASDSLAWVVSLYGHDEGKSFSKDVYIDALHGDTIFVADERANAQELGIYYPYFWGAFNVRSRELAVIGSEVRYQHPCIGNGLPLTEERVAEGCRANLGEIGNWVAAKPFGYGVYNAKFRDTYGGTLISVPDAESEGGVLLGDGSLTSTSVRTPGADAYSNLARTFWYLRKIHHREGLNGSNGPAVNGYVHVNMPGGAAWISKCNCIEFGPGDAEKYEMVAFDIVAHEVGHGVSSYGPKLSYIGEAGKISESMADTFAMLASYGNDAETVESFLGPGVPANDPTPYWIGERVRRANYVNGVYADNGFAIRYMDDPQRDNKSPACYSADMALSSLDKHYGNGPSNHAMFLLVYGGTSKCNGMDVSPIEISAARNIWYLAFHTLPPQSSHADLRTAFINAASQIYGGPSYATSSVGAAFDAINVPAQ
ncbi:MAG: M4 family metallopeptidase [Thermoanaerobaculia bacterium]